MSINRMTSEFADGHDYRPTTATKIYLVEFSYLSWIKGTHSAIKLFYLPHLFSDTWKFFEQIHFSCLNLEIGTKWS